MKIDHTSLCGLLLATLMLVPISPIWPALGVPGTYLAVLLYVSYAFLSRSISEDIVWGLMIFIILVLVSLIPVLFGSHILSLALLLQLLLAIIFVFSIKKEHYHVLTKWLTFFIVITILGAYLSILWRALGGDELFTFSNPDGRANYIFPFSMTNSVWNNFLRPSGIFDEPGAFSFFICGTAFLRQLLGFNEKKTFAILVAGLVTLSLAHIVFTFLFFLSLKNRKHAFTLIVFATTIFLLVIIFGGLYQIFYDVFLIRFELVDWSLHGDNRSAGFLVLYNYLLNNIDVFWFGVGPIIFLNEGLLQMVLNTTNEVGGNPLFILFKHGIFLGFSYYATLLFLIYCGLTKSNLRWIYFGFALLLCQRDYLFVLGYSFLIVLIMRLSFNFFLK